MPTPAMKRHASRDVESVCSAMMMDAALYQSSEMVKTVRRPNRSATKPNSMVPTNNPLNRAAMNPAIPDVPNSPGVVGVRICSRSRPGAT